MTLSDCSTLIRSLADVCRCHRTTSKWLVAPSARIGNQWITTLARTGVPLLNLNVTTLRGMALDCAQSGMDSLGLRYASNGVIELLVQSAFEVVHAHMAKDENATAYFTGLKVSRGLVRTMTRTVQDLRLAGMRPDLLRPESLEAPAKAHELGLLLEEYARALTDRGYADYAQVLKLAAASPPTGGHLYLMPADLELCGLERALLESLPEASVCTLNVDEPRAEADPSLWTMPVLSREGSADFYHAVGECNEVREVFRRCVEGGYPLDDIEILYTNQDTYLPLLYELSWHWAGEDDIPPVTFADGIPCTYARPGQALAAWLEWLRSDCPQTVAVRMLRDGLLNLPGEEEDGVRSLALASEILAGLGIWFGRNRYLSVIQRAIDETQGKLDALSSDSEADFSEDGMRRARALIRAGSLRALHDLFAALLEVSPRCPGAGVSETLEMAGKFVLQFARGRTELDANARNRLHVEITTMSGLVAEGMVPAGFDAFAWLSELIGATRVEANAPRSGFIHVAPTLMGGHSGRRNTFILGLDDSRFPGGAPQDPLLLDTERLRLSPELPTGAGRLRKNVEGFERMLARLRGQVTFSFTSRSVADEREQFPCSLLLAAYRHAIGPDDADPSVMLHAMGNPVSFVPAKGPKSAFPGEEWLSACIVDGSDGQELAGRTYPWLLRGAQAECARGSSEFTEYDGLVHAGEYVTGKTFSAGMLEIAGACPRRFWYRHCLGLAPLEDREVLQGQWLDAAKMGTLLHAVFREYMDGCIAGQRLPSMDDREALDAILLAVAERYKGAIPPPSDDAFQRALTNLRWTVTRFLRVESSFCRTSIPFACEAAVGMDSDEERTVLDTDSPVSISLGGNRSVNLRGQVDRVDVSKDDRTAFSVWDYKSGGSSHYRKNGPFDEGRMLQPLLYADLVQTRLRAAVDSSAKVSLFGYFCPSRRGRGERVSWSAAQLEQGKEIVGQLLTLLENGAFCATTEDKDCGCCDHKAICGNREEVLEHALEKASNNANAVLEPLRQLRKSIAKAASADA